ncbi:MAG: site-2 protease family protein [Nitrospinales bacterium]
MTKTQLLILLTPVILLSLTIHEYSHGKVAYLLGDDTAKRLGRLSFNPLKHLDPLGVIVFYFLGFGWAKPVPVDWRNFVNPRKDLMYVSLAGPLSNVALAVICGFFIRVISPHESWILFCMLAFGVYINTALAIFNMLPVYPLDGSSILKGLVPPGIAARLSSLDRVVGFLLLGIFLLDHFMHTGILWTALGLPILFVVSFLTQEAFPLLQQVLMMSFG